MLGMARKPFDPAEHGWKKVFYRRGDVLDRDAVEALVSGADVVVHLAFIIMGGAEESRAVNLQGSRNVFEAAVAAGAKRLVYASSVAAYGYHGDNPQPLTEDVAGARHRQPLLLRAEGRGRGAAGRDARAAARPTRTCSGRASSPGAGAPMLIDSLPYTQISERLPGPGAAPARRRADPAAGAARPGRAVSAGAPRRRRGGDARGGARPRQARRLQPRRAGRADRQAARAGARLVLDPGARAGGRRGRRDDRRGSASCPPRRSGSARFASR